MSHRKMHLALSLVLTLCGLLNSIFCETQPNPKRDPHPVSSRKTSPPSHEADTDHEAFAYKLFEALSVEYHRKNLIFSPESISTALAMLSLGTRSTTLSNLVAGLGFDLQRIRAWEVHTSFQRLVQTLNELDRQRHLKHRDFLFIDINRRIKPKFLQETERLYEVEAQVADFRHRGIAKEQINQFVAQRLAHRIEEVVTSLHPHTFLFLLNYIFFKGVWEVAFQARFTQKENFFLEDNTSVQVHMMRKTERMIYSRAEHLFATIVKLPYTGNVSLVLVLPDAGRFDFVAKELAARRARPLQSRDTRLVHLILPKFKISSRIDLNRLLPKVGIEDIFSRRANFSGITDETFPTIFEAIHEARLEVNEKGVIKAAAEDVHAKRAHHAPHADATVVKFDRPFLLFVEDELNQRQLFVGQVFNPLQ
ncbi:uteroferrin-associated basic protein 2-like [Equus asinus]|uniref:Serpin domain-containing protein n=1 Tax=Equus asinus TaxID=9793 RepID=A0A8C4N3R9_EQUAS